MTRTPALALSDLVVTPSCCHRPWLASAAILYFSSNLRKLLGDRGLTALERLMGMLLVMVAVEMLMTGAAEYLRGLTDQAR